MTEMVPELTNGEFENFFREGTVLVNFFAEWCMPCMIMGPIVEDLRENFLGRAKIGRINIEDNPEIVKKFEVTSVPCFILFKEGKAIDKIVGGLTQDELSEFIERHL
jgi:thioredoxin 1